jgi:AcrR family transcriptional regulator
MVQGTSKKTPASREKRGARADGDVTRAKILEAAGRLFAEKGFAHTTNRAVCQDAGVDLAAINYHFESRDGLYRAVLLEGHARLVSLETLQDIQARPISAQAKLEAILDIFVEVSLAERAWPVRVLARELLSPTPFLRDLFNEGILPKARIVWGVIAEITGLAPTDPALFRCMISVMAPCVMLVIIGPNSASAPPQLALAAQDGLGEQIKRFALGGLAAIAASRT